MTANDKQIGGTHYESIYQPWDFITDLGMCYLSGNVVKYVSRYRKKAGVQDLQKALHYLQKLKEVHIEPDWFDRLVCKLDWWKYSDYFKDQTKKFRDSNDLNESEVDVIAAMAVYSLYPQSAILEHAERHLQCLIKSNS